MANKFLSPDYVMKSPYKPKRMRLESFWAGMHTEVLGGWYAQRRCGGVVPLTTSLAHMISSIWLFVVRLCNKPVI